MAKNETTFVEKELNAGWLVAVVCIVGPALVALVPMAAAPALVAMAKYFEVADDGQLFSQMVMTLPAAVLIVSAPFAGWMARYTGQRIVLLVSLVLYVIGGAGAMFADSREVLIALRLLLGVAGGGVLTSCLGLIGDHFCGVLREKILGYATAGASLLAALALIYGGRLVDFGGWQAPFALYLLGIPVFIVAFTTIRDVKARAVEANIHAKPGRELAGNWPYYALLILLTLGMFTPSIQAGFVLSKRGIGSAETIGAVIAATSFVAMLTAWAFGFLRRWIGLHGFLLIDALSMGIGILIIGVAQETWQIFIGCSLVGIGAGMSEPAIASLLFNRLSIGVHALAMGIIVSALNAGQFINPLIFSTIRSLVGTQESFIAVSFAFFASTVIIILTNWQDIIEKEPLND